LQSASLSQQSGIGVCVHAGGLPAQLSNVQALPSAQSASLVQQLPPVQPQFGIAVWMHVSFWRSQVSTVHESLSLHCESIVQQPGIIMFTHTFISVQKSSVHAF
jgi:hypothetical protein